MFESIQGWIQANPLITAWALCYLLTFAAVRQVKPLLPHFELQVKYLPVEFRKRLILRTAVFGCGLVVSAIVSSGLLIFGLGHLTVAKAVYISLSVGFLAPLVYDLLWGTISLLEFCKVLPKGISRKIKWLLDPEKVEVVVNKSGEIEKVRQHDQTIWRRKRGG